MGCGTWTTKDWDSYTTTRGFSRTSSASELYKNSAMKDEFNPKNIDMRESCDSDEHPNSSPIILGLDVTGSMSSVLETVSLKLNTLITEIFKREPVTDPQIMFLLLEMNIMIDVRFKQRNLNQISELQSSLMMFILKEAVAEMVENHMHCHGILQQDTLK